MIEIGPPILTERPGTISLRYPLRAPAWVGLQRDELVLEYPASARPEGGLGEAAVMSLLPFAFWAGSHLRLDPALPLDDSVRQNAAHLCRTWGTWFRRPFALRIQGGAPAAQRKPSLGQTALFFSGGGDSLGALLMFRDQVDALIFVRGSDLYLRPERLDVEAKYTELISRLDGFAEAEGKSFLVIGTNVREVFGFRFRGSIWSEVAHGCAITALLAPLAGRFSTMWIASNGTGQYERTMPSGSNHYLTSWLSVPGVAAVTPDPNGTRYERFRRIARHPGAVAILRVCSREVAEYNCGDCKKCCRSMATLILEGVKPGEAPFPRDRFNLHFISRRVATYDIDFNGVVLWSQLLEALERSPAPLDGKPELIEALRAMLPFYEQFRRGEFPPPTTRLYHKLPGRPNLAARLIGFPALNHGSFRKWLLQWARAKFGRQRLQAGRPNQQPTLPTEASGEEAGPL